MDATPYIDSESRYVLPDMFYWEDPDTGKLVMVSGDGTPLPSAPGLKEISAQHMERWAVWSEEDSTYHSSSKAIESIVVDQWGNIVRPLYPPGDFGMDSKGSPTDGYVFGGAPADWPPYSWPPGNVFTSERWGTYSQYGKSGYSPWEPPSLRYWEDPDTGKLVVVGEDGNPMTSPPALAKLSDGSVVDQWGNPVESLWPPGDLGVDEKGALTGSVTMPEGFQPPSLRYWEDPDTGKLVAVDESGQQVATPPALTKLSSELRQAMGFPPGEDEIVVDQWGNVVISLHPPGNFGFDPETGVFQGLTDSVPEWPPDTWPPDASPSVAEDEDVTESAGEGETDQVSEESEAETEGESPQAGVDPEESEPTTAAREPDSVVGLSTVEIGEVVFAEAAEHPVATAEFRVPEPEAGRGAVTGEEGEPVPTRIRDATEAETEGIVDVDSVQEVGSLGSENVELVGAIAEQMVVAESVTQVRETEPEVDATTAETREPELKPTPTVQHVERVEFKVEMTSPESTTEVEPGRGGESLLPEAEPPMEYRVAETISPVGMGAAELVDLISQPGRESGQETPGVVTVPPVIEESVSEIPLGPPTGEADDLTGIEGKVIPVLELEDVEFKVDMAPVEVESVDSQVQVAEAGTLQEDQLEVSDLRGVSYEPAEGAIDSLVLAEEDEEPGEPAR